MAQHACRSNIQKDTYVYALAVLGTGWTELIHVVILPKRHLELLCNKKGATDLGRKLKAHAELQSKSKDDSMMASLTKTVCEMAGLHATTGTEASTGPEADSICPRCRAKQCNMIKPIHLPVNIAMVEGAQPEGPSSDDANADDSSKPENLKVDTSDKLRRSQTMRSDATQPEGPSSDDANADDSSKPENLKVDTSDELRRSQTMRSDATQPDYPSPVNPAGNHSSDQLALYPSSPTTPRQRATSHPPPPNPNQMAVP